MESRFLNCPLGLANTATDRVRREEIREKVEAVSYPASQGRKGSVLAEYGIGLDKTFWLPVSHNQRELGLMRTIEHTLDPSELLNPGKVL